MVRSAMIKVAQCLAGAPYGGAENFYTRLVVALASQKNLQQKAFTRENVHRLPLLKDANVPIEVFKFGSPLHWLNNRKYQQSLTNFSPDVVLTFMNRASGLTPRGNYKLVCRLGHYYNLKYYRHADYWIGVSKGICKYLIANGMPEDRVIYLPNFADESIPAEMPRESFSTPKSMPLLLAAGRLHENKAFDILFRALAKIPDTMLWLAGDGPEKQSLMVLADELNIRKRVRFLGWRSDVAALMKTADIFVCPSRHEGLGSIVIESWRHGCPIVATASQGPSDLIEHDKTGLLSPVDDAGALEKNIKSLLNDEAKTHHLINCARMEYQNHYSQDIIVNRYNEFFQKIVA